MPELRAPLRFVKMHVQTIVLGCVGLIMLRAMINTAFFTKTTPSGDVAHVVNLKFNGLLSDLHLTDDTDADRQRTHSYSMRNTKK